MRSLPPLTALRAFEAAGRHLSFRMAAAELALTATAISHQIRLLEEHCGKPLFRRRPRPICLTLAGEQLLPAISAGLDSFADGMKLVVAAQRERLRVTSTNAFAARWLVPRLPDWRAAHPDIGLDIMGTDIVLNLAAGEVDIAIRYSRQPPADMVTTEVARDRYVVVASPALIGPALNGPALVGPALVGPAPVDLDPVALAKLPLIDAQWPKDSLNPPMWSEWCRIARSQHAVVPNLLDAVAISFREDLHSIEAAIAGHGVAICSDILVAQALTDGTLIQVSSVALEGYGYFLTHRPNDPNQTTIAVLEGWIAAQFRAIEGQGASAGSGR